MHHKQIHYIHLHQHHSWEHQHGAPQPGVGPVAAAQRWPLSAGIPEWLQDNAVAVSYLITTRSFTHSQGVGSASSIPASRQFNPFHSWAFLPSMPDHSLVTNYHCWAVTNWNSPSIYSRTHETTAHLKLTVATAQLLPR